MYKWGEKLSGEGGARREDPVKKMRRKCKTGKEIR